MDFTMRQFGKGEWAALKLALDRIKIYQQKNGLSHLMPIIDRNDRVGFLRSSQAVEPELGTLIDSGANYATIRTELGETVQTSPFLVFRID